MTMPLLILQTIHVAFLWTHDWIPLGRMNDVAAVRRQDGRATLVRVTLIQSLPFSIGLFYSAAYGLRAQHTPGWLWTWLWISYGVLFAGELTAWWIPYLVRREPDRAARYKVLFGNTHAFLPERQGIIPNTLHCLLHLATLAMLLTLTATPTPPK